MQNFKVRPQDHGGANNANRYAISKCKYSFAAL